MTMKITIIDNGVLDFCQMVGIYFVIVEALLFNSRKKYLFAVQETCVHDSQSLSYYDIQFFFF